MGIIGPETFDSPWVPYEIGSVRGRQRFSISPSSTYPRPHPLIAHLIRGDVEDAPDFVALGTPLVSLYEVTLWAQSVAAILAQVLKHPDGKVYYQEIRDSYGLEEIYKRNTAHLYFYI